MKLNTKRTMLVGLAFLSICIFWQMYDSVMTLILTDTFHLNETIAGAVMAADNVLALFLLPLFGALSDKTNTRIGRRMPYIIGGTAAAVILMNLLPVLDNAYAASPSPLILGLFIAVLALLLASVLTYGRPGALVLQDVCVMAVAGLVIPWAFSCMLQLRMLPHGAGMVLMPLVAAFCSDSAALFTGMACGRHKMAPLVSPHKTVEGALGGIAGGVVGMVIFRIVFYFCTLVPLHIGWCVVIGLAGALMGELGDLSFSVIKRQVGIKDYGRLLPGHGGVLDRFDSIFLTTPVTAALLLLLPALLR